MRTSRLAALLTLAPAALLAQAAKPDLTPVEVKEWSVPWKGSRPRDPFLDKQGRVWFVGQEGNYVAHLDPKTGKFTRVEIEAGTNPHNVVVAPDGMVWYTGNRNARIVRLDPRTGKSTTFAMPDSMAKDPHTIAIDQRGDVWFTVQFGNYVGRLTPRTGKIQLVKMPTAAARPYGIVIDPRGRPWFNEFGTTKVGTIDPTSMTLREFALPHEKSRGRRIALTSDGRVWYVDYVLGVLGALDPHTGKVEEVPMPSGGASFPYAMTVDDRDRLWAVETGVRPNRLVAYDPSQKRWVYGAAIGAAEPNTVRHMSFDPTTREIWFGTDQGTIGRAKVPMGTAPVP